MKNIESEFVRGVGYAALAVFVAACGGVDAEGYGGSTAGEPAPEAEASTTTSAEPPSPNDTGGLAARSNSTTWFRWSKGEPVKRLESHTTHICALAMVRGELARDTGLLMRMANGFWEMGGDRPGDNFLQMDAVCEPLSAFRVNVDRTVAVGARTLAFTNQTNTTITVNGTPNTAAILSSVKGAFDGRPERAWVDQGTTPTVNIKNGGAPGTHFTIAHALSFGLEGNQAPFFVHDGAPIPTLDVDGHVVHFGCPNGDMCMDLADIATSFCFLTSVSGDFRGGDEWASVFPKWSTGKWHFAAAAGNSFPPFDNGGQVKASAMCLLLDQTRRAIPPIR